MCANDKPRNQPGGKLLKKQGLRDQSSPRFFIVSPALKISKLLEPLAFPKGSKISEILESLGRPQEGDFKNESEKISRARATWSQAVSYYLEKVPTYNTKIHEDNSRLFIL